MMQMCGYSKVLCELKMTLKGSIKLKPHKEWSFFILKFDNTNANKR